MSSSLIRRRPRRTALLGAVVAIGLLAGCTGQRDPGGYGDGVRKDFIAGCDGSAFAEEDNADEMMAEALPTVQCECIYDTIEDTVDFDVFNKANSQRRDEPSAIDEPELIEAFNACGPDGPIEGEIPPTTDGETTTTTEG